MSELWLWPPRSQMPAAHEVHVCVIAEQKVDRFILARTKIHDARVDLLKAHNELFVLFGGVADTDEYAWPDIAGEIVMQQAVARLAGFGHSRIAFIGGDKELNFEALRRAGCARYWESPRWFC